MTPVVAGVTMLVMGVTMLVPRVLMWVLTTEPGVTTAGLEEERSWRRAASRPIPSRGVIN